MAATDINRICSNPTGLPSPSTSRLYAESFGLRIVVEADENELLRKSVPWLPGEGWSTETSDSAPDRVYRIEFEPPQVETGVQHYAFSIDGTHKYRSANFAIFTDYFESDIHHYVATYTRGYLFVHAGVAVLDGKAIVIPGRSFAGKSTLTRALLDAGATYYSDDYAVIDDKGLVHPFPRHLRLRDQGTVPQNRVNPLHRGWIIGTDAVPIGIVAALHYDANAGWDVQKVSKGAGVLALLSNTVAARNVQLTPWGLWPKQSSEQ
ncbi:hypothetical protein BH23CHL5_BH23CHL5_03070 [soil metagenome]